MIGVCYTLWYTAEGAGGIAAQLAAAQSLAALKNVSLSQVGSLLDANITPSTNPNTLPGFQQLTQMLSFGVIDTVVVATLNRIAQDSANFAIGMQALRGIYPGTNILSGGWDTLGGDQRDALTAMLAGS